VSATTQPRAELELLTAADAARVLGCSRQNVSKLGKKAAAGVSRSGFPAPAVRFAAGALWMRSDIESFAKQRRRARSAADEE
jgi:hypothetical protein